MKTSEHFFNVANAHAADLATLAHVNVAAHYENMSKRLDVCHGPLATLIMIAEKELGK